jgi:flagellar basal-body rod modification protein FlgD
LKAAWTAAKKDREENIVASAISAIGGSATAAGETSSKAASASAAAPTQEMFLQLLVAQIKNQDPLNPADSLQFVSQLAQFSELEQVMGIRQDIEGAGSSSNSGAAAAATQSSSAV